MGDTEQIVLEANGQPVIQELNKVNRAADATGEALVRVFDKSTGSINRLIASMERQAATYGKTGADRLIAQRDLLIGRYASEQKAVDAITRSYNTMIDTEKRLTEEKRKAAETSRLEEEQTKRLAEEQRKASQSARLWAEARNREEASNQSTFSTRYALLAAKDLFEGRGTFAVAEGANFMKGLQGAPLLIGGVTAAFAGLMLAAHSSAESLSAFGLEMENLKSRTGIATEHLNQFVFAAKAVGQDASIYERMMKGLSSALGENSREGDKARETLKTLGVQVRDGLTGELKSTEDVLLGIAKALDTLPQGFQRDAAARDLFNRAGEESVTLMEHLNANYQRANDLHLGVRAEDVQGWVRLSQQMKEAGAEWDHLKLRLEKPLAAVWSITMKVGGKTVDGLDWFFNGSKATQDFVAGRPTEEPKRDDPADMGKLKSEGWKVYNTAPTWPGRDIADKDRAKKIAARQEADAYIRNMEATTDTQRKLHDAEAELAKMTRPEEKVTSIEDARKYKAAEDRVNQLKEEIKYTTDLKEARKSLQSFTNTMNEHDLNPVQKLQGQLADYLAPHEGRAPLSASQINTAKFDTAMAIIREMRKEKETFDIETDRFLATAAEERGKLGKDFVDSESFKALEAETKFQLGQGIDDYRKYQTQLRENDKSKLDEFSAQAQHVQRMTQISSRREGQQAEIDAANQEFAVKQKIRDTELQIVQAHSELYDIQAEENRIALEGGKDRLALEEQIAEIRKKEFDEVEKSTERLVNTLFTNPSNFGKQLGQTIEQAMLAPIQRGISQTVAGVITPVIYGRDGRSGIAGALGGVFGQQRNPVQVSTDMNTTVTAQNTTATYALVAALSRGNWSPAAGGGNTSSVVYQGSDGVGSDASNYGSSGGFSLPGFGGSSGGFPGLGGGSSGGFSLPGFGGGSGSGGLGQESLGIPQGLGRSSSNPLGAFKGILGNFKGMDWGGFTHASQNDNPDVGDGGENISGRINGVSGVAGALLGAGGMMLASRGIFGADRGTSKGILEGAGGGAMIGMQYGGTIGAAIGAAVGAGIGGIDMALGILSPENKAKKYAQQFYHMSISNQMASQIAQIAKQKYAGNVALAVRDPETRQMLQLYSYGTGQGQSFPMSQTTPNAGSLAEVGGRLFQQAGYQYGHAYSYQSSLPVEGGYATGQYPSTPSSLTLNVNGQSAADLLDGRVANVVNPSFVASRYSSALDYSNGRMDNSAMIQQPGLIVS